MATTGESEQTAADARARHLGIASVVVGFILFATSAPIVAGSDVEGLAIATWRMAIAAGLFAALSTGYRSLTLTAYRLTALPGLSFGVATGLFFEAAQRTSVANATLIAAMQPIAMVVAARFVFGEAIGVRDFGYVLVALAGAGFMISVADTGGTASLSGDLIAVSSIAFTAGYFIFSKKARQTVDTVPFMAGLMFWGAVVVLPMTLVTGQDLTTSQGDEWLRFVALAIVPGSGHLLINHAHRFVPFLFVGVMQQLLPVFSTLFAWWFLDQTINGWQALGMAVVIGALSAHTVYRSRLPTT